MTKKIYIAIDGGFKVRRKKRHSKAPVILTWLAIGLMLSASSAFAQGSIFGSVANSDASTPANGEISFFGYLDDTDEEIRIEASTGAGYDAGNWFDDFQNFLTEAPGNPYDYHFYNTVVGEGFILSGPIPNNSFQQEDITLASVLWPLAPTGVTGVSASASSVILSWTGVTGLTYHVYRRDGASTGSFFRIDDPTGSLANPGVADSFFVDNTVDGVSSYDYLIIAEDGSGNLSPHSSVITINSGSIASPVVASIDPITGVNTGGTLVNIYGSGFDQAGATVTFGVTPATATYVSPFHMTVTSPAGPLGAVDISVTNTASTLVSNVLTGAFTYEANSAPVVSDIPDQTIAEGSTFATINLDDFVDDIDNTDDEIVWTFSGNTELTVDITDRVATITIPDVDWNGAETITFTATDPGTLFDSDDAIFTVNAVNDAPVVADIPDQTVDEGSTFTTIALDDFVSDVDNVDADMTWSFSGNTELAVAIDGSNIATITIPDADWNGAETITFTATDPGLETGSDPASFTVNAINDAPVVADILDQTIDEGSTFATINLDDFVDDVDNIDADIAWTYSGNTELTVAIDGSNIATITIPDVDWNGAETITFTATDPGTLFDSDDAIFTVNAINDAPVVADIPDQSVAEGSTFATINLDDFVADVDNLDAEIAWTYSGNTELTVDIDVARVATITIPSVNWNGSETITFTATDPGLLADSDDAIFTVSADNDPPVVADIPDQTIDEGSTFATINLDDFVDDLDNVDADIVWTYSGNTDLTVSIDGARVATITMPSVDWNGAETITFTATDPGLLANSDAATFTVNAVNDAPVVADIPDQTVAEGASFATIALDDFVDDVDNLDDEITWTYSGNTQLTVDIDVSRVATITIPNAGWNGAETITFTATDPGLLTGDDAAVFTVSGSDDAPVLDPIGPQTIAENANLNFTISAIDPEGVIPTLSATGLPTNSTFNDNLDGSGVFDFTPDFDQEGIYEVVFKAFDGALVDSEVVVITVTNTNQLPVLAAIGAQTATEGIQLTIPVSATDADGTTPVLSTSTPLPGSAVFTDNADGTGLFDWTPEFTSAGLYTVTFYAIDGVDSVFEDVEITVGEAGNQPPVVDPVDPQTIGEGQQLIVIINASDPDGTIPTLTATDLPANAIFTDSLNGVGTIDFTPGFNQSGVYNVTITADDGALTDDIIIEITVNELGNQPPIVAGVADTTIDEGDSLVVVVTATDPEDGNIFYSLTTDILSYTFVDSGNGVAVFSFEASYFDAGDWNLTFFATDDGTPIATGSASMVLTVNEVNQSPVFEDVGLVGVAIGDILNLDLTASDTTDSDPTHRLFLTAIGLPANSSFIDNGDNTATFTFEPVEAQVGQHIVTFIATDEGTPQLSANYPVTISVVLENRKPVFDPIDPAILVEGEVLNLAVSASDPDGTIPNLSATGPGNAPLPENAVFTDNLDGTGTLVFSPNYVQAGLYGIYFEASDGIDVEKSDPVLIQVTEAGNQAPEVQPATPPDVTEGETFSYTVTALDPDETIPTLAAENLPENATFVDNGDGTGTIDFNPLYYQSGTYDVSIIADDGELTDTLIVTLTVLEAGNQTPALTPISDYVITEGGVVNFTIIATDPDNDIVTFTSSALPGTATLTDNGDNTAEFNWVTGFFDAGNYGITIYATDPSSAQAEVTFNIDISNVNRVPYGSPNVYNTTIFEQDTLVITVTGTDPDGTTPIIEFDSDNYTLLPSMNFVDSGNGVATLTFIPEYDEGASSPGSQYFVRFLIIDSEDTDSMFVTNPNTQIFVLDRNMPPQFVQVNDTTLTEGEALSIGITVNDVDEAVPITTSALPDGASFLDWGNNFGVFGWNIGYLQSGTYPIEFYTIDALNEVDTMGFTITVLEAGNQAPVLETSLADTTAAIVNRTDTIHLVFTDPEEETITINVDFVPLNATFVDSGNGSCSYLYSPNFSDLGQVFNITFTATDATGASTDATTTYRVLEFVRGDSNSDNDLDMSDAMFLFNFLYREGEEPLIMDAADVNYDTDINLLDALYLLDYIFRQGPPPPQDK